MNLSHVYSSAGEMSLHPSNFHMFCHGMSKGNRVRMSQLVSQFGRRLEPCNRANIWVRRWMLSSERRKGPEWYGDVHHLSCGKVAHISPIMGLNVRALLPHMATLLSPFTGCS